MHSQPQNDDAKARSAWLELTSIVTELHGIWWSVDLNLSMLLAAISGMRHAASATILATVTANKVKRDIVRNVAGAVLATQRDVKAVDKILSRMARAAKVRNHLAHASFSLMHDGQQLCLRLLGC